MPKADQAEPQFFFRFTPDDEQPGFNPLVGDVEPKRVYEVRPEMVERFVDHPQWTKASKRDHESQDES